MRPFDPPRIDAGVETVTIKFPDSLIALNTVSPGSLECIVSKARLCAASSFFRAALSGPFKEAQMGTIHLSDEKDARPITTMVEWLDGRPKDPGRRLILYPGQMLQVFLLVSCLFIATASATSWLLESLTDLTPLGRSSYGKLSCPSRAVPAKVEGSLKQAATGVPFLLFSSGLPETLTYV